MESVQSSRDQDAIWAQSRGSKRTEASDLREHRPLMTPCFPRPSSPSPRSAASHLRLYPLTSSPSPAPPFHGPAALSASPSLPGFSVCPSTSLPCCRLQGSAPKRLISHVHPRDPLTLDSADLGGTVRRLEARGDAVGDVPSSQGPLFPAAAPIHRPPSFAGFGYPLPLLGFRLLAAPSRVPCPPALAPSPWLQAPLHALPCPLPPSPGSL